MALESTPKSGGTGSEFSDRPRKTPSYIRNWFATPGEPPKSPPQIRWERRWTAAAGAWSAVLLALLFGATDWRLAVMVAATAFMLARSGDMLDDY